jgi:LysR family hydrogen peroxide-inducible transcriptional activator
MNISWLTIRDLQYLVSVAQHLHFGRAAKATHVSQPALSAQIKKIEDFLGFSIFERTNRRVALTERGAAVVEQARVILEEAEKLTSLTGSEKRKQPAGTLRMGIIATLGPYYVPEFLPAIRKHFPDLNLFLKEGLTDGLLSDLRSGSLDVVLAARTFDETGFRIFPLFYEPFLLAVPRNHPLAKMSRVEAEDLKGEDMVLLEDGHCLRDQALKICPPNRRGNIRQFHATSLETLRYLVASGMGYTLMPKLAVRPEGAMKPLLKYRRVAGDSIGRSIVLVCREQSARIGEIGTLAEFLRKHPPEKL